LRLANPVYSLDLDWKQRCRFMVDPERRTVVVHFEKNVTASDIRRYAERLQMHPAFDPRFSEIVDLQQVEDLDLQAPDFLKLADEVDPFSPDAWRAFVVRNSVQNHAARMHKVLRMQANMRIFYSLEQAETWIQSRPSGP